jgi:hypothetical protein
VTFPQSGTLLLRSTQHWISFYGQGAPNNLGVPGCAGGSGQLLQFFQSTYTPTGQSAGFELLSFGTSPRAPTWAITALGFAGLGLAANRKARPTVSAS